MLLVYECVHIYILGQMAPASTACDDNACSSFSLGDMEHSSAKKYEAVWASETNHGMFFATLEDCFYLDYRHSMLENPKKL